MALQTVGSSVPKKALDPAVVASVPVPVVAKPVVAPALVKAPVDVFEAAPGAKPTAASAVKPEAAVADPGKYMHDLLTGAAPFPADFEKVMGYSPVRVETKHGTRMQDPNGDVSSPGGIGPTEDFLPAAKTHDLGYDILRYFGKTGQPLGPEARKVADAQFREDCFHEANDNHGGLDKWKMRSWAQVYATAVELNSKRQGYGVP